MKNVSEKTPMQNVKTALKKKMQLSLFSIIAYICLVVLLSASVYYYIGLNDGYSKKVLEIQHEQQAVAEGQLMEKPLSEVKDIFQKYLMIKTMAWLPLILFAILLGWVLHGLMR